MDDVIEIKSFEIDNIFSKSYIKIASQNSIYLVNKNITKFSEQIYYKEFDTIKERDLFFEKNYERVYNIFNKKYLLTKNYLLLKDISDNTNFVYNLEISSCYYNKDILKRYAKLNKCVFFNLIE